jgi:hypothetical protein
MTTVGRSDGQTVGGVVPSEAKQPGVGPWLLRFAQDDWGTPARRAHPTVRPSDRPAVAPHG